MGALSFVCITFGLLALTVASKDGVLRAYYPGDALMSPDPSVDRALIPQCSGLDERALCQAVTPNMEVFDALQESEYVSLLPGNGPATFTLQSPPKQNIGSKSFFFRKDSGNGGDATITVTDEGAISGIFNIVNRNGEYMQRVCAIESCGNGCNVLFSLD